MSKKVFSVIERVTPEMAVAFLANNPNNRPINKPAVQFLVRQMKEGTWSEHVAPIVINCDGELIDGQTRLSAVIQYGKPVRMEIKRNVPDVVRPLIDTGRKRQASDWLQMTGVPNSAIVAGAARIVGCYRKGSIMSYASRTLAPLDIQRIVEENSGLIEWAKKASGKRSRIVISPSQQAALSFLFSEKDDVLADVFCSNVSNGFDPEKFPSFHRVRETIMQSRVTSTRKAFSGIVVLAFWVKAWNATRTRRPLRSIRWSPSTEEFPKIL